RRECQTLLARGTSAASTVDVDGAPFSPHTIGPGGALRGVLAIGSAALDEQARSVVTTVVAMTGFALEQTQALTQARGSLRAGVVRALIAGDTALARDVGSAAWGGLPADPVTIAAASDAPDALETFLELRAAREQGGLFFGRDPEGGLAIALPADASFSLEELAERFGLSLGVADPAPLDSFADALGEARMARGRAAGVARFSEVASSGLLSAVSSDAERLARALLAPVVRHDETHGTTLVETLREWLLRDGRYEDAARVLGVHRHTVRTRIRLAGGLLDRDLDTFAARAEVWVALLAVR